MSDFIKVQGAREHNLKNVSIEIPRNQLVVITGLSGSGKSSLAFDTIYAEGQRRYVESLSAYARQFLGLMEKPDVDYIEGLSPAISIDQKSTSRNPRSTVATVTEIYDYLRLLYARIGIAHGPDGKQIQTMTIQDIASGVENLPKDHRMMILAPVVVDKKGEHAHVPELYTRQGYARARVDGIIYSLEEFPELDKKFKHNIEIIMDRVVNNDDQKSRIFQAVENALQLADGQMLIIDADDNNAEHKFSQRYYNPEYPDFIAPDMEPRTFSFNSPHGACPTCTGLGNRLEVDPELVLPNGKLTIAEGAIRPYNRMAPDAWNMKKMTAVAERYNFSTQIPTSDLTESQTEKILYGTGNEKYTIPLGSGRHFDTTYEGVIPNLERRHKETDSDFMRREIERFMVEKPCHSCHGKRLKASVLAVTVKGVSIMDICERPVADAVKFFAGLKLTTKEQTIATQIFKEINDRLRFLNEVGLGYLTLARSARTLSGGEAQRIRLATQIGSGLQGVLYVLDEPSIGLHQRDNGRLIATLKRLRELGNSVIVVEHDEETIKTADFLVDIGPGAGVHGGEVVAFGKPEDVAKNKRSITGKYLRGELEIKTPKTRRKGNGKSLMVRGARENNLKNIDVELPLGKMVVVSGVSGSGKSTLINDIIAKELHVRLSRAHEAVGRHDDIEGIEHLDKVIIINQSPIGRTPRSNPATYVGLFTPIRDLFASTPESKIRGYKAGRFSFNVKGGRCENCQGDGMIKIEMHFLPDVYVSCEVCNGKRYNSEALDIHYKGKTISDVLDMTCEQALDFFQNIPTIAKKLETLVQVGLGYMRLGQSATTLSGGEAQRVKLATELSKRATGRTLYVLDEPTTGLHMDDVNRLLEVLHALVDTGNSMVIIEHNLDVVKSADHVIDMGPEGGEGGGQVIAEGTPEQVSKVKQSFTGQFLKEML
ncbi:MAG: excinuclease ABC subunit A [Candidatus Saccharimonadales bacterium]